MKGDGERWLRWIGDGLTVVVGVVVLGILGVRYLSPSMQVEEGSLVDVRLSESIGIDFNAAASTLVMVLSQDCVFCSESMPFYRRLLNQDTSDVQIVVAAPPHETGIADYLASEGVMPDSLVFAGSDVLPVRGTPTLLYVNGEGSVTHVWIGLLSAQRETEVIETVFGA